MQLNIFELNGHHYALPAASIREVVETTLVTPLPFTPADVDGLVNVAGQVIVQIDLSVRLEGAPRLPADRGNLIVVDVLGTPHAVHVGRAVQMVEVADESIRRMGRESGPDGVNAELVEGEFQWSRGTVLILTPDKLGLAGMQASGVPEGRGGILGSARSEKRGKEQAVASGHACLLVETAGERYALPLREARELVEVEAVTRLPKAPAAVAGITVLRGRPYLLLSLAELLGLRPDRSADTPVEPWIVITEYAGTPFGLLVERVVGIRQYAGRSNHRVLDGKAGLAGYYVDDRGGLVGAVEIQGLIGAERFAAYESYIPMSEREMEEADSVELRAYLGFQVGREHCALPLDAVERVVEFAQVGEVPAGGGRYLDGVVEIQGEVLPVADLRRLMRAPLITSALTAFVVAHVEGRKWALVVDRVHRVMELRSDHIEATTEERKDFVTAVARLERGLVSVLTLAPLAEVA